LKIGAEIGKTNFSSFEIPHIYRKIISMQLLDGRKLAETIKEEIKLEVHEWTSIGNRPPHLAAILVGDDPASAVYVRNKIKVCEAVGFHSSLIRLEKDVEEEEILEQVHSLNNNSDIDGFIVQLPLPGHINEERINLAIDPKKDVDGFHPVNVGRMSLGLPSYLPATPQGILYFIDRYKIETKGKKCVVVGRSNIVGRPISILLSQKASYGDATVTVCHRHTKDINTILKEADIIVSAVGVPHLIKAEDVKEGAVVIDVGMNRINDETRKSGTRLVGDVDFDAVAPKTSFITPVPGGVGRMTVISLIINTLKAAKKEIYG